MPSYATEVVTSEERVLMVYIMLTRKQIVNHEIICEIYGCSKRTFRRIMTSIREVLEGSIIMANTYLTYNRKKNSYEIIHTNYIYDDYRII